MKSIGWAVAVRLRLVSGFHRNHPSPAAWSDVDRAYLERLRADISLLRDTERRLIRRSAHTHTEES